MHPGSSPPRFGILREARVCLYPAPRLYLASSEQLQALSSEIV